jgi:hypothetical protein
MGAVTQYDSKQIAVPREVSRHPLHLHSYRATCGGPRTTDNHRRIALSTHPSTRARGMQQFKSRTAYAGINAVSTGRLGKQKSNRVKTIFLNKLNW